MRETAGKENVVKESVSAMTNYAGIDCAMMLMKQATICTRLNVKICISLKAISTGLDTTYTRLKRATSISLKVISTGLDTTYTRLTKARRTSLKVTKDIRTSLKVTKDIRTSLKVTKDIRTSLKVTKAIRTSLKVVLKVALREVVSFSKSTNGTNDATSAECENGFAI